MFTRRLRAPRSSTAGGNAPHCRLCGTEVSVDDAGRCRLGHQVGPAALGAEASGPVAPLREPAPDTAVDEEPEEPRRVTASPLDTLVPQPVPTAEAPTPEAPTAEAPTAEAPTPEAPTEAQDQPQAEDETARARLLEASSWFTDG